MHNNAKIMSPTTMQFYVQVFEQITFHKFVIFLTR